MNRWTKWNIAGSVLLATALAPVPVLAAQDASPPPAETGKIPKPAAPAVTLDLRDAPLRQALEQLFHQAKVDYSIDNSIQGYVSLKITEQPFENALRLLLRSSPTPLTYVVDSGVYIVRPRNDRAAGTGDGSLARSAPEPPRLDASNQIVAGGPQWDTISLTYLDPVDVSKLLSIIIIPTFSRQGAGTTAGGGAVSGGNNPGSTPTPPGAGGMQAPPIVPSVPIRISQ